jgi:hypothetical protein
MPTRAQIEKDVVDLPTSEKRALLRRLQDLLEDELKFTDEFKAKIECARRDIAQGRGQVVRP